MHYEFTSRVRYSEIAPDGAMTLPAIVSRMQDCSVFHSDAVGRGPAFWLTDERGWIIVSWQIVFRGTPHFGEALTTRTWGTRFHGIEGDRNFTLSGPDGTLYAEAYSRWVYYDLVKDMPIRVPKEESEAFGTEPALTSFAYAPRKIVLPETPPEEEEPLQVQPMAIDTNHHVNNLVYIQMAASYLPADFSVRELRVQYLHQAKLGDVLVPKRYVEKDRVVVALALKDGPDCAVAEFFGA